MEWTLFLLALIVLAGLSPVLARTCPRWIGWVWASTLMGGLVLFLRRLTAEQGQGNNWSESIDWVPSLGIHLRFSLDGLSSLFVGVILLVGACVFLYAQEYLRGSDRLGRFYLFLSAFLVAMLGLVTADNFMLAFIFWELTSFTSYLLIGHYHEDKFSRKSALQALTVTGLGGLAMMAGLMLVQLGTGFTSFSEMLADPQKVFLIPHLNLAVGLILLGGLTKSAQFPFHFWLPNAMAAPAPVSAFLHSATMVKAGVFLFLRLDAVFQPLRLWSDSLTVLGGLTFLLGGIFALRQHDLKKLFAYTTVSILGALTMMVGLASPLSYSAALLFFVAHGFYKGSLFMGAGIVDHETGERDVRKLRGLGRVMPITALVAGMAGLSAIGIPPFLGFVGKEIALKAILDDGVFLAVFVLASGLGGAVAWVGAIKPYLGPKSSHSVHDPSWAMVLGPLVLSFFGLVMAFDPSGFLTHWIRQATPASLPSVEVKIWTGLNLPLVLSLVVLGLAVFFVVIRKKFHLHQEWTKPLADRAYDAIFKFVLDVAERLTIWIQNGNLRQYLQLFLLGFVIISLWWVDWKSEPWMAFFSSLSAPRFWDILLGAVMIVSSIIALRTSHRLTMIISLGGIGLSMVVVYAMYGAPDLALTQALVETLTVILFVFLLHEVPLLRPEVPPLSRQFEVVLSLAVGGIVALLTAQALVRQTHHPISGFFGENSYLEANGRNVVNVILVDFRGFDTLGEITVLGIAALGIVALFRWKREGGVR